MNFYIKKHRYYCGIDLHAKSMYICIQNNKGETLVHRNMRTKPEYFLKVIKPYKKRHRCGRGMYVLLVLAFRSLP